MTAHAHALKRRRDRREADQLATVLAILHRIETRLANMEAHEKACLPHDYTGANLLGRARSAA